MRSFAAIALFFVVGCDPSPAPSGSSGGAGGASASSVSASASSSGGGSGAHVCDYGDECTVGAETGACDVNGSCCTGCLRDGECLPGDTSEACGAAGKACRSCPGTEGCEPTAAQCKTTCSSSGTGGTQCEAPEGSCVNGFCQCNGCVAYNPASGELECVEACPIGAQCNNGTCTFGL